MNISSRREFIAAAAVTGSAVMLSKASAAPADKLEGVFPIVQTPFQDSGALDVDTLIREIQFLHRIGVQGVVWPQLASEYPLLTYDERIAGAEAIMRANKALDPKTRPAVVIGVQAPDTEAAVKYARHADKLGPDAIIAIPLNQGQDEARQMEYYSAIGKACSRPLFVQTVGNMSVDLVLRMAKQIPTLQYVKDEAGVTLPRLTEYRKRGQMLKAVFTGKLGPTFLDDLERGAVGNMPAAAFPDLYVAAWQAWKSGKKDEAMEAFGRALLLISEEQAYGMAGRKYMLQVRGVFPNAKCRGDVRPLDDEAKASIRRTMEYCSRWFRSGV